MTNDRPIRVDDLHDVIDQNISALIRDLAPHWSAEEVILAIDDVVKARWLARIRAGEEASDTMSQDFISDGNEG
jgi:hypothetical protein